jgi:hypothetical protein
MNTACNTRMSNRGQVQHGCDYNCMLMCYLQGAAAGAAAACRHAICLLCSPAWASAVLMAELFSGGQFLTPSRIADALPAARPLQTLEMALSACAARALATCKSSNTWRQQQYLRTWLTLFVTVLYYRCRQHPWSRSRDEAGTVCHSVVSALLQPKCMTSI